MSDPTAVVICYSGEAVKYSKFGHSVLNFFTGK